MKHFFTLTGLILCISISAQVRQLNPVTWPESDDDTTYYHVKGYRHGVSFTRQFKHAEVQYEPGKQLTFDQYHTADVMYYWYKLWAEKYSDIVDLYEVGTSFEGRPILQMTITNKETGKDTDKPAAFFEGGRHSGEITGSESVLWLTQHLLENYGSDPAITKLIDTKAIYLRPQNNPDGGNLYLHTAQRNRSTVRPHDNDRDGLLDEDDEEDLDGDGIIYQIRRKAKEGEKGTHKLDPRDPSRRLMTYARDGDGDWFVYTEGIDNDGDGSFNEDGIGGLDLHRNYPENWRPDTGEDATGRGYTQRGAGAYPTSEPESRSIVMWMLTHPNISVANSMDTRVPMHLRAPSTSKSTDRMYPEDLALYERYDSIGLSITNYPWAGDVYETYATRYKVNRYTGDPLKPSPLFGHGPDFGYFYYGSIWYGDELWNNGAMKDYNNDGIYDDYDGLRWDDEENDGNGFREWEPFDHPTLGEVEIGGFHPKFFGQNGPPWQLENWAKKQALFNLAMALELPQLELDEVKIDKKNRNTYTVKVSFTNTGLLPTALLQAQLVKIVREDRVQLQFKGELTKGGDDAKVTVASPTLADKTIYLDRTLPGETKTATFEVKFKDIKGAKATVKILSTRGGYIQKEITIGEPEN
ncbi:zinc carboxypeptidase [Roseivirga pacifica]|uniref:Zinc carboxypeptidase n=1 Tax=Roseivirga pacifica TaxID=1267423 RepID=A0A1I0Q6X6_9BACT|nr:M14 family metallopeptidase [Roseivirga pacifica]RKQ43195.1 zinc carboxypeptidase [Roseivirga pacifica]SEW22575.1 Zinc carboxypeptidase [Roseivirga pacifica]